MMGAKAADPEDRAVAGADRRPTGWQPFGGLDARAAMRRAPSFRASTRESLKEVSVRQGDNRHVIVLLIENFQETVNVEQDAQAGAADRRGDAFGSGLTREQMDALSDDPDEMQRQLMDMAGPARSSASTASRGGGFRRSA